MKIRVALIASTLLFGLVSVANAQLKAGSPEDEAYTKIEAEKNADAKLALLLDFEKKFPNTNKGTMVTIYMMTMDIYSDKNESAKIAEYGDKAIAKDPENVSALLRVSRNYTVERTNLGKAVEYAEKAKKLLGGMRTQPTPTGQTDAQWKQWLDANQSSAEEYAKYATMLLERQPR
jgi:hypothetical protein